MSRVAFYSRFERPERHLMENTSALQKTMRKISTGKEINKPSDNPPDLVRLFRFHNQQDRIKQYQKNINSGKNFLENSEGVMDQTTKLTQRIRELGVRAANDSLSANERNLIAEEVDERLEELLDISNSKMGGRYLFGGAETEGVDRLFNARRNGDGEIVEVTYNGDRSRMEKQVGDGEKVISNLPGHEVFQASNQEIVGGNTLPEAAVRGAGSSLDQAGSVPSAEGHFQLDDEKIYYNTKEDNLADIADKINSRGMSAEAKIQGNSDITGVDTANNEFDISGDHSGNFSQGDTFNISGSTGNDGEYTVQNVSVAGGDTTITVQEDVNDSTVDGQLQHEYDSASVGGNHDSYQLKFRSRTPHKLYLQDVDRSPDNSDQVTGLLNDLEFMGDGSGNPPKPTDSQNFPNSYHQDALIKGKSLFDSVIDLRESLQQGAGDADGGPITKGNAQTNRSLDPEVNEGIQQGLEDMQEGIDNLLVHRSIGGARTNRLESAQTRSADQSLHTKELISQLEDADLAEVITDYRRQQAVQQASMRMSSKVMKTTLANYI